MTRREVRKALLEVESFPLMYARPLDIENLRKSGDSGRFQLDCKHFEYADNRCETCSLAPLKIDLLKNCIQYYKITIHTHILELIPTNLERRRLVVRINVIKRLLREVQRRIVSNIHPSAAEAFNKRRRTFATFLSQ